jgi:hypothetical protein
VEAGERLRGPEHKQLALYLHNLAKLHLMKGRDFPESRR